MATVGEEDVELEIAIALSKEEYKASTSTDAIDLVDGYHGGTKTDCDTVDASRRISEHRKENDFIIARKLQEDEYNHDLISDKGYHNSSKEMNYENDEKFAMLEQDAEYARSLQIQEDSAVFAGSSQQFASTDIRKLHQERHLGGADRNMQKEDGFTAQWTRAIDEGDYERKPHQKRHLGGADRNIQTGRSLFDTVCKQRKLHQERHLGGADRNIQTEDYEDDLTAQWTRAIDEGNYEVLNEFADNVGYVNRGMSEQEIKTTLPDIKSCVKSGSSNSSASIEESDCKICFEDFSDHTLNALPCLHKFHKSCILPWLKINATCPICKSDVKETVRKSRLLQ